ncbi:Predicted arabinose efflux permease, MFS family [Streptomyces zhaozhouensis]|uniref:Predicted arabinose efflux permease, MFS family n=1 Tax=Streptomyces zhaozhouensis TaxID=1300267 RepID=A0A286DWM6_9ACTN|nr:MFS transporter [Streptomyces zhaozhouensis]SOD63033.1 Predicted arabinose efflux permease, MFS family [Streptomyces zhaozhouensis]
MAAPPDASVLRAPGMTHLLAVVLCCFSGFALLLPVSPTWAVAGGADEFGAGLVTAVLMAATVLSQLRVRAVLRRVGWPRTLTLGALLLGLPAPLQALSDTLPAILATTALRGAGFGILTVCGSTAVAALAPRGRQGAAIGVYGLAIALPQVVLTPAAPWLVDTFALPAIIACGALPVLALPLTPALGRAVAAHDASHTPRDGAPRATPTPTVLRRIRQPLCVLLLVTAGGGAVLTFAPQFTPDPTTAAACLLTLTATAAAGRWACGILADRVPPRPIGVALLLAACAGLALTAAGVAAPATAPALLAGALLLGAAYGGLQSVTLVQAFRQAGPDNRHTTSVAWNIGYDSGTGLGSLALGLAAQTATFATGFATLSAVMGAATLAVLLTTPRPAPSTTPPIGGRPSTPADEDCDQPGP